MPDEESGPVRGSNWAVKPPAEPV